MGAQPEWTAIQQQLSDHDRRIARLEDLAAEQQAAYHDLKQAQAAMFDDITRQVEKIQSTITKQLNGTMLTVLGGVVTYLVMALLGVH